MPYVLKEEWRCGAGKQYQKHFPGWDSLARTGTSVQEFVVVASESAELNPYHKSTRGFYYKLHLLCIRWRRRLKDTMSGRTEVIKDFTTPDRSSEAHEEKKELSGTEAHAESTMTEAAKPNTVTPPDSTNNREELSKRESAAKSPLQLGIATDVDSPTDQDKHVHFNRDQDKQEGKVDPEDSPTSSSSQRGLVSRRGGRCVSPGRTASKPPGGQDPILEFKTFRSPPRKRDENDTVPSLCSTSEKAAVAAPATEEIQKIKEKETSSSKNESEADRKPLSISCDSSKIETTSPLHSNEREQSHDTKASRVKAESGRQDAPQPRKNNVTFSPVPSKREDAEKPFKTPTKSPTRGRFQSLPSLEDTNPKSPVVGLFLSPHPPTPSAYRTLDGMGSFDKEDAPKDKQAGLAKRTEDDKAFARSPLPKSPKTRDQERERFVATPTDFAMDYGKHPNSGPFDNSNVLSWLQSPTANGLFSPGGGLGSLMNTPRGTGAAPRTPRTPTVSTSFFFSDVAGLPQNGEFASPKPGGEAGKRGGSQRGYSNIICISPLASSKTKNGSAHQANTPINYKDVFASPAQGNNARGLPMLGDSPAKGSRRGLPRSASRDPCLDAVHMAERDLMEDEDLSVLLQLASNTPRPIGERPPTVSTSDGTHVFRSPTSRKTGGTDENLPSLQLPVIGGREGQGNGTKLTRKTHSRDHGDASDRYNPTLSMRSNSGGYGKSIGNKDVDSKRKYSADEAKKAGKKSSMCHPPLTYSMPPPGYPHPGADVPYYQPMPPGMPPGGSMRVVVGGHPPPRPNAGSPQRGSPHRAYPMGPGDPNYPPPPYYLHPGVPPPHMAPHPHYSHYPPLHHRPPPPHMPMYGAQHPPPNKSKVVAKKARPMKPGLKPGIKRPSPTNTPKTGSATKKQKKASPPSAPKKKNKSPQLTERGDRQKAAATIQAVNAASGGKNDRAAALAAAILRGVTMRPSGKWQAQLYFAGKSRYIGVFDTREKAALAYEIAREKLKSEKLNAEGGSLNPKQTDNAVNSARKAAFEGVNERDPRLSSK